MQCQEIQERLVELLYQEKGTPVAGRELQEHVSTCASCRQELAELKEVQAALKVWQDEPALRPVVIPRSEPARHFFQFPGWRILRYAAVTALVILSFLALSNADIQWNKDGFSFKTSLLAPSAPATHPLPNSYTREETQELIKRVMAKSEETSYLMIQRALDYVDQERQVDVTYIKSQLKEGRTKN
jgi:hypothetical protein